NKKIVSLQDNTNFDFLPQQPINQPTPSSHFTPQEIGRPIHQQVPGETPKPLSPALRSPNNIPPNISPSGTLLAPMVEMGMPTLTVSSNIHSDRTIHTLNKQTLNIGRDPENDIVISEHRVSAWL